jgi:hypothetical protein
VPDRLATQLLRIARNPRSGRLRHPRVLDIGLRAALLAELVLDGRVVQQNGAPFASGVTDTGDRVLDAVARTVEARPNVRWWRWFRHVRQDRAVLVAELLESGRWTQRPGGLRPAYDDADEGAALALTFETNRVVRQEAAPRDARQGVLAILTVMSGAAGGRPHPRALRSSLKPIVEAIAHSGERGADLLPRLFAGASTLSRRPTRR